MVKVVNIFKAAGLWVGTIFLLYGTKNVDSTVATAWYYGGGTALAPSRSPEQGGKIYGREKSLDYMGQKFGLQEMQRDVGSLKQAGRDIAGSQPHGGGTALGKRHKSAPL